MRTALTIAGSDSSGGAGIQADLHTFAALGVYGTSAITAITAQNSMGVQAIATVAPEMVAAQIDAVLSDMGADAVKIGMLATGAIVEAVADALLRYGLANVVLDPVMLATRGPRLLDDAGIAALRGRLLPLATVITPNLAEAAALTGFAVHTLDDMRRAALALTAVGARAVVVKGGHLDAAPIDLVFDGWHFTELAGDRIDTTHTHGTGCRFASALAARLAQGDGLVEAATVAKAFVARSLKQGPG